MQSLVGLQACNNFVDVLFMDINQVIVEIEPPEVFGMSDTLKQPVKVFNPTVNHGQCLDAEPGFKDVLDFIEPVV